MRVSHQHDLFEAVPPERIENDAAAVATPVADYLIDPRSGKTYTFVTDSVGGRQAVGELKDAIMTVRQAQPGALPVVQLATGSMKTKYGVKPRPDFKIIDWRSGMSSAPAQAQQQIEEQAEDEDAFGVPFGDRERRTDLGALPKRAKGDDSKTIHPFDDDIPF